MYNQEADIVAQQNQMEGDIFREDFLNIIANFHSDWKWERWVFHSKLMIKKLLFFPMNFK